MKPGANRFSARTEAFATRAETARWPGQVAPTKGNVLWNLGFGSGDWERHMENNDKGEDRWTQGKVPAFPSARGGRLMN